MRVIKGINVSENKFNAVQDLVECVINGFCFPFLKNENETPISFKRNKKRTSSIFHFASQNRCINLLLLPPTTAHHYLPLPTTTTHHHCPPRNVSKKEEGIRYTSQRNPFRAPSDHCVEGVRLCVFQSSDEGEGSKTTHA